MHTALLAGLAFLAAPVPELSHPPMKAPPRFMQVGGVPGFAPPGLPDPPVILRLNRTPPPPYAPRTIVLTYGQIINGIQYKYWTSPGGGAGIYHPYHDSAPVARRLPNGMVDVTAYGCFTPYGILRVNSANPYQAGPNIWNNPFLEGYTVEVGP